MLKPIDTTIDPPTVARQSSLRASALLDLGVVAREEEVLVDHRRKVDKEKDRERRAGREGEE